MWTGVGDAEVVDSFAIDLGCQGWFMCFQMLRCWTLRSVVGKSFGRSIGLAVKLSLHPLVSEPFPHGRNADSLQPFQIRAFLGPSSSLVDAEAVPSLAHQGW